MGRFWALFYHMANLTKRNCPPKSFLSSFIHGSTSKDHLRFRNNPTSKLVESNYFLDMQLKLLNAFQNIFFISQQPAKSSISYPTNLIRLQILSSPVSIDLVGLENSLIRVKGRTRFAQRPFGRGQLVSMRLKSRHEIERLKILIWHGVWNILTNKISFFEEKHFTKMILNYG